jgi:subtilisin family serine protease
MSKKDEDEFYELVDLWSGYSHGTAVADIALSRNPNALAIVARMEWWYGSPPVPCWTRELADREAKSIGDLLQYLVKNGARVVNMSWGRFESSYTGALKKCSPAMPESERKQLARYTVEKIRKVLQEGMKASPNVLYVGAAGNSGTSIEAANPATRFSLPNFLIVGAVDRNGAKAKFTNTGSEVTLYANGERVTARMPGGEMSFPSGTSMAVPNVVNPAVKMLTVAPRLTGAEMRKLLEQTADANATGQKIIHPARAVEAARSARL